MNSSLRKTLPISVSNSNSPSKVLVCVSGPWLKRMRVALVSSYVPFVNGGARFIVEWLEQKLSERGHQVERIYLPFSDYPRDLLTQMAAYRSLKIDGADRVICFRPPAHLVRHPNKVLWFIHHFRAFYDLWDSEWAPLHTRYNQSLRRAIFQADGIALSEARAIFTNSRRCSAEA